MRQIGIESAHVEWDVDACATLRANGFDDVHEGDVRDLAPVVAARGPCDFLWASPPCQDFSSAGKRAGAKGSRNGWPWTLNAIDVIQPTWVVCENVPGLLQHSQRAHAVAPPSTLELECPGCYWERVVVPAFRKRFAWVDVWLLDAADFGVPQRRRRVFLVCGPESRTPPRPTHAPPQRAFLLGLRPWVSCGEALGLVAAQSVHGGGGNPHGAGRAEERNERDLTAEPSVTIPATQIGNAGPWVDARLDWWHRSSEPSEPSRTVGSRGNACVNDPAPTLSAGEHRGGWDATEARTTRSRRASDIMRRRLTVDECAALQGFPSGYRFEGKTKTSLYRQVGNAVPPALAAAVAGALLTKSR